MKLKVIRFFNINSLKGKHEILFDQEPLLSSGLFAITGATGAGKSTILDVITLALYNYVPRLGKVSKTGIEKMGSIVTHFTAEAWAEVEYEAQGQKYMSRWSISKTRNDTYREYEMDIVRLPEQESLGLKKSEVPDKNAKIIGLNVDQFMKSIILSQGDFSRFLQAKKEDRTKLLQEITGTKIYQNIGRRAYEMVKDKNAEIELIESKKAGFRLLNDEEKQQLETEVKGIKDSINYTQNKQESIRSIIQLYTHAETVEKIQKQIREKRQLLSEKETEYKHFKPLLDRHNDAKDYEEQIMLNENLERDLIRLKDELDQAKNTEKASEKSKEVAIKEASNLTGVESDSSTIYQDLIHFQQQVNALDSTLKQYETQGKTVRSTIQKFQQESDLLWVKTQHKNARAEEAISDISARLTEIQLEEGESFSDLQSKWSEKQVQITVIQTYKEVYIAAKNLRSEIQKEEKWIENSRKNLQEVQKNYTEAAKKEREIEKELVEMKAKQELLARNSKLEAFSHMVEEGKPCPLCGSMNHPDVLHDALSELEKVDLKVAKLDRLHKSIEIETKQNLQYLQEAEWQISNKEKVITSLKRECQTKQETVEEYKKEHGWLLNIADEKWNEALIKYNRSLTELAKKIEHFRENEALQLLLSHYRELKKVGEAYKRLKKERDQLYMGQSVTEDADKIQNAFTIAVSTLNNSQELAKRLLSSIQEKSELKATNERALRPLMEKYEVDNSLKIKELLLENIKYRSINEKREAILSMKSSIETLQQEKEQIQSTYTDLKEAIREDQKVMYEENSKENLEEASKKLSVEIQNLNKELGIKSEKLAADHQANLSVEKLEEEIAVMRQKSKTWILLNEMIGDSKGKKFANFAQNLTLMHLLNRANARLASLTDRYTLSFKPDEEDLLIVDRYQGDTLRAVKTLSGGETFIISLALALSLSDFAAQSIQLESLFIDEGFGTLDQETLDLAMTTLEKLQHNSGKRIGIISHVESLKERIQTQIIVNKNARGYSSLAIVSK